MRITLSLLGLLLILASVPGSDFSARTEGDYPTLEVKGCPLSCSWSRDSTRLAFVDDDGAKVWDLTRRPAAMVERKARAVAFATNSNNIALVRADGTLATVDKQQEKRRCIVHASCVSWRGDNILVGSDKCIIEVDPHGEVVKKWPLPRITPEYRVAGDAYSEVRGIQYVQSSQCVAVLRDRFNSDMRLRDVVIGNLNSWNPVDLDSWFLETEGTSRSMRRFMGYSSASWNMSGRQLAVDGAEYSNNGGVGEWSVLVATTANGTVTRIARGRAPAWTDDSRELIFASESSLVLLDLQSRSTRSIALSATYDLSHNSAPSSVVVSPNGRRVALLLETKKGTGAGVIRILHTPHLRSHSDAGR